MKHQQYDSTKTLLTEESKVKIIPYLEDYFIKEYPSIFILSL